MFIVNRRTGCGLPADTTAAATRWAGPPVFRWAALAIGLIGGASACGGSSSTQVSAPTPPVTRCTVTLATTNPLMAFTAGSGTITISTSRDCTWQAQSSAVWLFFTSPTSGQGDATLAFSVQHNSVVAQRQAVVTVGDGRLEIRQAAAFCTYALSSSGRTFPASGGADRVAVDARDGCAWFGQASVPWIVFDTTVTQVGQGSIGVTVAPNSGPSRSTTVFIAGLPWVVNQAAAGTSVTASAASPASARRPSAIW